MSGGLLRLSGLWPPFGAAVRYFLNCTDQQSLPVTILEGYRSAADQAARYAQGRTPWEIQHHIRKHGLGGSVTDAPPGESPHQYGLAVDISSPDIQAARWIAQQIGFGTVTWDVPHIEWPNWRSLLG